MLNHYGTINVKVAASSYNDSGIRKAMIDTAAHTAMMGAAGKNCYQDTPTIESLKHRSLFDHAFGYVSAALFPRAVADGGHTVDHVTWCNTISFAGVQYFGEFSRLADNDGPTDYLDVGWTFHEDSGDAFDCEFLGELVDSLAIIAPEFTVEDVALGEEIVALCNTAYETISGQGGGKERRAIAADEWESIEVIPSWQGLGGHKSEAREFRA